LFFFLPLNPCCWDAFCGPPLCNETQEGERSGEFTAVVIIVYHPVTIRSLRLMRESTENIADASEGSPWLVLINSLFIHFPVVGMHCAGNRYTTRLRTATRSGDFIVVVIIVCIFRVGLYRTVSYSVAF